MKNATILSLQGPTGMPSDLAPLIDAAEATNSRLSVLCIWPMPQFPLYAVGAGPYAMPMVSDAWFSARNEIAEKLTVKQAEISDQLQMRSIGGEVATLCVEPAALHDLVAQRALFADICIVQDSLRDHKEAFDNVVYGLLFEAPTPLLLNVQTNHKAFVPDRVMIAWNNSLAAARAVRAVLPMLKQAQEVIISCFDPQATSWADGESPGADLASWLSHHGCRITVQELPTGGKPTADAILDHAKASEIDLVVMGAYGRHRLQERLFGGTTRSMLHQKKIPVLLAH